MQIAEREKIFEKQASQFRYSQIWEIRAGMSILPKYVISSDNFAFFAVRSFGQLHHFFKGQFPDKTIN